MFIAYEVYVHIPSTVYIIYIAPHHHRHQQLQFRPSLEEVRAKYYREMKKFICIPLHFRGVGESTSAALTIFPRMISRNAAGFTVVYKKVMDWFSDFSSNFMNCIDLNLHMYFCSGSEIHTGCIPGI